MRLFNGTIKMSKSRRGGTDTDSVSFANISAKTKEEAGGDMIIMAKMHNRTKVLGGYGFEVQEISRADVSPALLFSRPFFHGQFLHHPLFRMGS